jgi:flagellar L-ring protein precursor FlgH
MSKRLLSLLVPALLTSACAATIDEVRHAGQPPRVTPIENPTMAATGRRQVVMPMPDATSQATASNSLWRAGSRQFFNDPRASRVGDIVTVLIQINDQAQLSNSSGRTRKSTQSGGINKFFGLEQLPGKVLPQGFDPTTMIDTTSSGNFAGQGQVTRNEKVDMTVAAIVTQILPNGNMVVAGRQEVRINNELRELLVSGIVRQQDISSANQVRHTQMAEARISYGGRGQISAYQQPSVGQQVLGAISPF